MKKQRLAPEKRSELISAQVKILLASLDKTKKNSEKYTESAIVSLNEHSGYSDFVDPQIISAVIIELILDWYKEEDYKALSEIQKNNQIKQLVKDIDHRLDAMPLKYDIYLPLPDGGTMEEATVTKAIKLSKVSEKTYQPNESEALQKLLGRNTTSVLSTTASTQQNTVLRNKMIISDVGYIAAFGKDSFVQHDPFYLYKVFASASIVLGSWERNMVINALGIANVNTKYSYEIQEVNNHSKRKTRSHTTEDNILLNKYAFSKDINKQKLANLAFEIMLKKHKDSDLNNYREKLQKALFWYYELSKVTYPHLQMIHIVTAFDALFDATVGEKTKQTVISSEVADNLQEEKLNYELLFDLYMRRNAIIHGSEAIVTTGSNLSNKAKNDLTLVHDCTEMLATYLTNRIKKFLASYQASLIAKL